MAFPDYGQFLLKGFSESPESPVVRTEMEDGYAKEGLVRSRVLVPRSVTYFYTLSEYANFKTWFQAEAKGGLFFDWVNPVGGVVTSVRMKQSIYSTKFVNQNNGKELAAEVSFILESWEF